MNFKNVFDLNKGLAGIIVCLFSGFSASKASDRGAVDCWTTPPVIETGLKAGYHAETSVFVADTLTRLTDKEKSEGWEVLFDGKNTDKWRGVNRDDFPANGWAIEQGALVLSGKNGGDIITREKFSDFELVLDFKLTPSANSGIKYFVGKLENKKNGKTAINGPEYQIIDDDNYPELKNRQDEKGTTAALYLLYPPQNKKLLPGGQWNQAKIIAKGKQVEHWLNGIKVVSYERGSKDFRQRVAATKFQEYAGYGEAESGHILLTDHGDKVYFKNIKVRRL